MWRRNDGPAVARGATGCYARRPNAAASAFNARARARANVPGAGRPVRTSNARQSASDHATAASAPQRGQRIAGAGPSRRARAQQLGHTPYLRPAPAAPPASGPGTTVHAGGRSGSTCTKARGVWSKRWLTSAMASTGVSSTTRDQATRDDREVTRDVGFVWPAHRVVVVAEDDARGQTGHGHAARKADVGPGAVRARFHGEGHDRRGGGHGRLRHMPARPLDAAPDEDLTAQRGAVRADELHPDEGVPAHG